MNKMEEKFGIEKFGDFVKDLDKKDYKLNGFLTLQVDGVEKLKSILKRIVDSFEGTEFAYKNYEKNINLEVMNKQFIKNFIEGMTKDYFSRTILTAINGPQLSIRTHGNDIVVSNRTSDENVKKIIEIWKEFR